ncbi:MAG: hypothetical protein H7A33_00790 [Deltaproteobacteria bacterium]|nr:hypothetical protein [Deltaproteobacteria bacterium]
MDQGMMTDNTIFEFMIHLMELSVVLGIAATIWYIKTAKKDHNHESRSQSGERAHLGAGDGEHHRNAE